MKHFYLNIILIVLLLSSSVLASGQVYLTAEKAVRIGLNNNFKIQIQEVEGEVLASRKKALRANNLPKLNLSLNQQNNANNSNSPTSFVRGFYRDNGVVGGVDMNWLLFDGFKVQIEKKRLKKLKKQNDNLIMLQVENTVHAILLAYHDLMLKREDLKEARTAKRYAERRLEDARYKFEKGLNSQFDVQRVENTVLKDSSQCLVRQKLLILADQQLNSVLGNKRYVEYIPATEPVYSKKAYNFAPLQQKLFSLNAELQNQYLNLYLRKNSMAFAKSNRMPKVQVSSGVTQNLNGVKFPEIPTIRTSNFNFYLNFSLSYNLFDGGTVKRQIEQTKLQKHIEELKIEEIKRVLSSQLQNAVANYNTQLELLKINEALLKNIRAIRDAEQDRYTSGFSSFMDFQLLKQEYEAVQKSKTDAEFELLGYELEILKLTGGFLKYKKG